MDQEHNNMEDFFRKKLSESEGQNDGWDKPDPAVWQSAQQQIALVSPKPALVGKAVLAAMIGLLLLLLGAYTWHLSQKIDSLEAELQSQNDRVGAMLEQAAAQEKQQAEAQANLNTTRETLQQQQAELSAQNTDLKQQIQTQQRQIFQLETTQAAQLESRQNLVAAAAPNSDINPENPSVFPALEQLETLPLKSLKLPPPALPQLSAVVAPIIKPSSNIKRQHFEAGYEFALLNFNMPVKNDVKNLSTTAYDVSENQLRTAAHGVYGAYSPWKNWYIRSGIRQANTAFNQEIKLGIVYDKTKEYTDLNGGKGADFSLSTTTPYNDAQNDISVSIPTDTDLKSGDLLIAYFNDALKMRFLQVPLGVEYFHGNDRWQWQLLGGVQWNRVAYEQFLSDAQVKSKNKSLPVKDIKSVSKAAGTKQYMSGYAGAGLDFRLSHNWHIRAAMVYEYDLFQQKTIDFSKLQKINSAFKLGLNYRF